MESNLPSSLEGILRKSHVIFQNNRNLMASISSLILLLHSFLVLCNFFSVKPLLEDLLMKKPLLLLTNPAISEYHNTVMIAIIADLRTFAGLEWFFILALFIVSIFSSVTIILASAVTYEEIDLSYKDLLFRVLKSLKRPLVTRCYTTLFDIGYVSFSIIFLFLPSVSNFGTPSPATFLLLILVSVFYLYLSVIWNVSLVIAVLEEKSGLEAFGKAAQLMKGMKLRGFLLNLVFGVLSFLAYISWNLTYIISGTYILPLIMGLLLFNITLLINMYALMAFTVFYHICKHSHGKEIELEGAMEYTKVPAQPLIRAEIP